MFITFLTVLSAIWVVLYLLGTMHTLYLFWNLTDAQQNRAKITLDPLGGWVFLLCLSWLITRIFS